MAQIGTPPPLPALPSPRSRCNSYQLPLRSCSCITRPCKDLLRSHATLTMIMRRFPHLNIVSILV